MELRQSTKDIKVKVSAVSGEAQSIYIDYLFDYTDLAMEGSFFVYDPTVTATAAAAGGANEAAAGGGGATDQIAPLSPAAALGMSALVGVGAFGAALLQ